MILRARNIPEMCFMNCELIVVKIKNVLRFEKYQKKGPQIISNSTVGGKQFYTKVLCNYQKNYCCNQKELISFQIGHLFYDPSKGCKNHCYTGIEEGEFLLNNEDRSFRITKSLSILPLISYHDNSESNIFPIVIGAF